MAKSDTASSSNKTTGPNKTTGLDKETLAALTLFNEYVSADRERTERQKRIKQAERAKDAAAAEIAKLGDRASKQKKAEAETAYREAIKTWRELKRQSDSR